jgi:hypothetical protein
VRWISRVPDTAAARAALQAALEAREDAWTHDGPLAWAPVTQAPARERWVVERTTSGVERASSGRG